MGLSAAVPSAAQPLRGSEAEHGGKLREERRPTRRRRGRGGRRTYRESKAVAAERLRNETRGRAPRQGCYGFNIWHDVQISTPSIRLAAVFSIATANLFCMWYA